MKKAAKIAQEIAANRARPPDLSSGQLAAIGLEILRKIRELEQTVADLTQHIIDLEPPNLNPPDIPP